MASQRPTGVPDYCNEKVFQRNRLSARSYWIPETSALLNGTWDFNYSPTPLHAPDPAIYSRGINDPLLTPSSSDDGNEVTRPELAWTPISVPGHWQLQGYGRPQYTNVIFPFPVCPPYVPSENPTGTYVRQFSIPREWDESCQIRLRLDGADSAFYIWVNGSEIGYSQGSRNPAEFDVTEFVRRDGVNTMLVQVYQWSDGSYIEDQDQWWLSGECFALICRQSTDGCRHLS